LDGGKGVGYDAKVIKVMLASPVDVAQERRVARDVVYEWNAVNAEDRRTVLMPIGWESHAFPEMGDRPQAIVNKQVLKGCDLLVAVFWTRLGTPTGEAQSGTVEEIDEHLVAGKPALIYFSSAPVRLDSVDKGQYDALLEFKESCRQRGLVAEYENLKAFRLTFSRNLAQVMIQKFARGSTSGNAHIEQPPADPTLTDEARELLGEAASDPNGTVMKLVSMGGTHVQANGREFATLGDARSEAKWRRAIDELDALNLLEDRAGKGELYFVTDAGYVAVDHMGGPADSA
jgi:hypothetical protein